MPSASKTIEALASYGNYFINRAVLNDPDDPSYVIDDTEISMILHRRGEVFDGTWLAGVSKIAASEGYPSWSVQLSIRDGGIKLCFTR